MNRKRHAVLAAAIAVALMCLEDLSRAGEKEPTPPPSASYHQLSRHAMMLQRAGKRLEAAEIYEQLIETDPARSRVLVGLLARLYAEAGKPAKALAWAEKVIEKHPDPQAYLAGVHAMCGDYKKAAQILDKEIAGAKQARRQITLRWQLADVHEKAGKLDEAEKVLRTAAEIAGNGQDRIATTRRLQALDKRRQKIEQDRKKEEEEAARDAQLDVKKDVD